MNYYCLTIKILFEKIFKKSILCKKHIKSVFVLKHFLKLRHLKNGRKKTHNVQLHTENAIVITL